MTKKIIYIKTLLIIFAGVVMVGVSCGARERPNADSPQGSIEVYTPNPVVPEKIRIWGETQDMRRSDLHERLDRELTALAYTHGNTLLCIKRSNRYRDEITKILKKNGVPEDMFYLAVIESFLDDRAYSPAKAAGIWQFIPSTAKEYGLEVNEFVDERYNLPKATEAACRYFKDAYARYGDWNTVAASYNGGMARISKELESQRQDSALDLYLTSETSRYPFRIMAMKLILENPHKYGFYVADNQLYPPYEFEEVVVDTPVSDWVAWSKSHGMSYARLRELNPWIRAKSLPNKTGKKYTVRVSD